MVARTGIKGIGKMVGAVFHRAQAVFRDEVRAFINAVVNMKVAYWIWAVMAVLRGASYTFFSATCLLNLIWEYMIPRTPLRFVCSYLQSWKLMEFAYNSVEDMNDFNEFFVPAFSKKQLHCYVKARGDWSLHTLVTQEATHEVKYLSSATCFCVNMLRYPMEGWSFYWEDNRGPYQGQAKAGASGESRTGTSLELALTVGSSFFVSKLSWPISPIPISLVSSSTTEHTHNLKPVMLYSWAIPLLPLTGQRAGMFTGLTLVSF